MEIRKTPSIQYPNSKPWPPFDNVLAFNIKLHTAE